MAASLTLVLAVAAVVMVASRRASEAVFAFFLTNVLLLALLLVRADVQTALTERVWATLLGLGLALAATVLAAAGDERRGSGTSPSARRAG